MRLHWKRNKILEKGLRKQKAFAYFQEKKEWVKLNTSYLAATATNFGVGMGSAYVAQKAGVSKESAVSWIAALSGFIGGVCALIGTWYFLPIDKYQKNIQKIKADSVTLLKNIAKAQIGTFAITIPGSLILTKYEIPAPIIIALQQMADKVLFLIQFNLFSIKYMQEKTKKDET